MIRVRDAFYTAMPSSPRGSNGAMRLIAGHTTEGGPGVYGAEQTIRYLLETAYRSASYHEIWAWEGGDLHVIRIVPPWRAAHSIAPQTPYPYQPDAWVRYKLGDKLGDPNMWVYAVSIAGRTEVEIAAYARNSAFLAHARSRLNSLGIRGLAEHFRFNPHTRIDWGSTLTRALGGLELPYSTTIGDPDVAILARIYRLTPKRVALKPNQQLYKGPGPSYGKHYLTPSTGMKVEVLGKVIDGPELYGSRIWLEMRRYNSGAKGRFFGHASTVQP